MKKLKSFVTLLAAVLFFNLFSIHVSIPAAKAEAADPKDISLPKTDFKEIPEVMNDDESLKDNFVIRLDDETDSLDVIRYLDSFDTERYLLFPINVKYVNEEGIIRDKSNTLYESEDDRYLCVNLDNDIRTYFPKYAAEGIKLTYEDNEILFRPNVKTVNEKQGYISDNTVVYLNAFGEGTDFVVKSTFAGNKSDIILNSYTGENVFEYTFEMKDMSLSFKDGAVCIIDANGNAVCSFGEVYVEDSEGHFTFGTAEVTDKNTVRVTVPEEFLKEKDTVYPVTIDPDLVLTTTDTYGFANISNAILSSALKLTGGSVTESTYMKFQPDPYHVSDIETIIKFPHLYWVMKDMSNISNASLKLFRKTAYQGTTDVNITGKPITQSWNMGSYSASAYTALYNATSESFNTTGKVKVGASATGSNNFVITSLANHWREGNWIDSNGGVYGIHFSASGNAPLFHGATTATASKMPRLTLQIPYDATGTISDAVYMINPTMYYVGGQDSGYALTRVEENGIPKAKVTPISEISNNVNYPITDSGYVSYMRSTSQLFSIKRCEIGYTIKSLATDQYLVFDGNNLTFSSNDDQTMFTTRWTFVKVNGNYYVLSYFGAFLYSPSATGTCTVTARTYTEGDGRFWHLMFYMLDIEHMGQPSWTTCGPTSAAMVLNYLGVDLTGYGMRNPANLPLDPDFKENRLPYNDYMYYYDILDGYDDYLYEIGQDSSNHWSSYGREQVNAAISTLLNDDPTDPEAPYSLRNKVYVENNSVSYMYSLIAYNLGNNYPAVALVSINSTNYQFTYTVDGHFVVICGAYTTLTGEHRVIIADSYPTSDPNFVELKPGNTHPWAYAFLDCPVENLRAILKYNSLICSDYDMQ